MQPLTGQHTGEVVEAATGRFVFQTYEVDGAPPFGALVRTTAALPDGEGEATLYGVVYEAVTAGVDPSRRPIALGRGESGPDAVFRAHPQLAQLFRTDVTALVVGYQDGGPLRHAVPTRPARIHGFVHVCSPGEAAAFTGTLGFLSLLAAASPPVPVAELLAAFLNHAADGHAADRRGFLVRAGKELAVLWRSDPQRLATVLARLRREA